MDTNSGTVAVQNAHAADGLIDRFFQVRAFSEKIVEPLSPEDCVIQSMDDASPIRWHLAHTTWFFETFLLKPSGDYRPFDERFEYLFNSYYNSVGEQYPRGKRGLISRPGLTETLDYRSHVDQAMRSLVEGHDLTDEERQVLEIGIHHEQQHQELMLTDLKHALSCNPLAPVYRDGACEDLDTAVGQSWLEFDPGVVRIGHDGDSFCFDNELPRHRVFLEPFQIADRCVTNREYLEFMEDGGYDRPELWLSLGWAAVKEHGWRSPLYWTKTGSRWSHFTLSGRKPIRLDQPVCHVSYFEADAYARWAGCRLATEAEWEHAVCCQLDDPFSATQRGNWSDELLRSGRCIHPKLSGTDSYCNPQSHYGGIDGDDSDQPPLADAMGNVWEWTSSHYSAYPGYHAPAGALGEYNGKFMCNVFVLKGGSCATPSGHARPTYRNFFAPESRWQFTGIRLARC
ncbi:ergothioneine biosynthesis protein EgtB [Stieleria sp.]|uniref:ergothioneine biosynthesis protein EgtB n=1 Tax=Stieleria sp. TaxID=2795976 RepID=UPI003569F742